jgi:hypothetical protein
MLSESSDRAIGSWIEDASSGSFGFVSIPLLSLPAVLFVHGQGGWIQKDRRRLIYRRRAMSDMTPLRHLSPFIPEEQHAACRVAIPLGRAGNMQRHVTQTSPRTKEKRQKGKIAREREIGNQEAQEDSSRIYNCGHEISEPGCRGFLFRQPNQTTARHGKAGSCEIGLVPPVSCLLSLLLSSRFKFPPPDATHAKGDLTPSSTMDRG